MISQVTKLFFLVLPQAQVKSETGGENRSGTTQVLILVKRQTRVTNFDLVVNFYQISMELASYDSVPSWRIEIQKRDVVGLQT